MKDIMLDLETFGTNSRSAIVAIAAVQFDIETGNTGKTFYQNIELQSSADFGLEIDPRTVMWWISQSEAARGKLTDPKPVNIISALEDFSSFIKDLFPSGDFRVWGNSARFDLGILSDAYKAIDENIPWNFRNEMCLRTLVALNPEVKANYIYSGTLHNAVHDCYNQIGYCSRTWNSLKKV
jgi:hypothetical protein